MTTEKIIYKMLTESTGEHFLDSGGAYGRHWQRNQKKSLNDFKNEKYITFDNDCDIATKSLFHHLTESLTFNSKLTNKLNNWIKKDKYHYSDNPKGRCNDLESVEQFMSEFIYPDRKIYTNYTYNEDNVLSQDIQFIYSEIYETDIIALSIHNGCDARGGFTDYKIFNVDWDNFISYSPDYYKKEDYEKPTAIDEISKNQLSLI
jgi:hypothetical protein